VIILENTTKESLFNSLFKEIWSEGVFSLPLIKFFNIKKYLIIPKFLMQQNISKSSMKKQ